MKKVLLAFLSFAAVMTLSFAVCSDGVKSSADAYSDRGIFMVDKAAYLPEEDDGDSYVFPDLSADGKWTCSGLVSENYTRENYGATFYYVKVKNEKTADDISGSVTYTFDLAEEKTDLTDYSFFRFAIGILRTGKNCSGYFVRIKITTADGSIVGHTTAYDVDTLSELDVVTVDTSDLSGEIKNVVVTVFFNNTSVPEQIKLSSPYFSKQTGFFDPVERYLTPYFRCEGCSFSTADGKITPDDNGDVILSAEYGGDYLKTDGKMFFCVKLDGINDGSMSVRIRYCDSATGEERIVQSQRLSLYEDADEYIFPIEVHGVFTSYSIILSGVPDENEPIIDQIRVTEDRMSGKGETEKIGAVTRIGRDGDLVRFEGTLERSTVKAYSDAEIGFFACPIDSFGEETVEIGRIQITTKFEYTADVSGMMFSTDTYKLMAAVITSDGYVIPISSPRYFDSNAYEKDAASNLGLHGTAAVGAFESNASHVIVDVPLDDLFMPYQSNEIKLNYTVYGKHDGDAPYSQRSIDLRKELLSSLDEEINFYITAGIRVYIRFVSDSLIPGVTYSDITAENYSVSPDSNEMRHMYAAVVSFFAKRYPGLDGFVVGEDISRSDTVGTDIGKDITGYVNEQAELCRLTYNAAAKYIDVPVVAVPMSDGGDCGMTELCVYLSDRLSEIGNIPWTLLFISDGFEVSTDRITCIGNALRELGYGGFSDKMIFLKVKSDAEPEGTSEKIGQYCIDHTDFDAVIFSVDEEMQKGNGLLYSKMKNVSDIGYVFSGTAHESDGTTHVGEYTLCDFSDKYYTLGWRAVGVDYLGTDDSVFDGDTADRVLRADFGNSDSASAGILLKNFDKTADLGKVDTISFEVALGSDTCDAATVVFVIGCDEMRAEYSTDVVTDGCARVLSCELGDYEYSDRVDFVGIMLYADGDVSLEVKNAKLESSTLSSADIGYLFSAKEAARKEDHNMTAVLILSIGVVLVTCIIVILITRKENEMREAHSVNDKKRYRIIK